MGTDSVLDDIQDLNLSYLLLAQRLLREDRATAMFRLKLGADMAELLMDLSGKQLVQLARSNQLICRLAFEDAEQLTKVLNNQREQGLSRIHAALLMASAGADAGRDGEV